MQIKKIAMVACLSLGLALAGCSTAKKNNMGVPVSDATANGAATAGYDSGSGYGGGGAARTCSAQAPQNQSYYFDLNQYDVHSQDYSCINAQAKYLVAHPSAKIRLEGNCDNRGSREYNRALGWKRANAVRAVLMQQGVAPSQITTFSWGSEKASAGTGEAVWSHDRRVDLIYKNK